MHNAFVESFNDRFRDECLNETLFSDLAKAPTTINEWKEDYNKHRPHSALGNMPPAEFAAKSAPENLAAEAKHETEDSILIRMENGSQVSSSH